MLQDCDSRCQVYHLWDRELNLKDYSERCKSCLTVTVKVSVSALGEGLHLGYKLFYQKLYYASIILGYNVVYLSKKGKIV